MKEFRFWAITHSMTQLFIMAIPVWIAILVCYLLFDFHEHFEYFFIGGFIWSIIMFFVIIKRIKVIFTDNGNQIQIFINKKEKYSAKAEELRCIKAGDINNPNARNTMTFMFSEKNFSFRIFEENGSSRVNNQISLLRHASETYSLDKQPTDGGVFGNMFIYNNPRYNNTADL